MFRHSTIRRFRRRRRPRYGGRPGNEPGNAAVTDLLAGFRHELRTPLHGLSGMLELLQDSQLSGPQQQLLDATNSCSRLMAAMLDGAIEIPGRGLESIRTTITHIDLASQLEETISIYSGLAASGRLELGYSIAADTPMFVAIDAGRLRQVLNNLLSNAIRHSGGSRVMVRAAASRQDPAMLSLVVSDDGNGMGVQCQANDAARPPEVRQPETTGYTNSGLGLKISKALVRSGGGCMNISARAGGGTSCDFTLPIAPPANDAGDMHSRSQLIQRKAVLIIATVDMCESIGSYLQRWGIGHKCSQSSKVLQDSDLHCRDFDTLILEQAVCGADLAEIICKFRCALPGGEVAVLLPFAGAPDRPELDTINCLTRPLKRDRLAAWLMGCNLRAQGSGSPNIAPAGLGPALK